MFSRQNFSEFRAEFLAKLNNAVVSLVKKDLAIEILQMQFIGERILETALFRG